MATGTTAAGTMALSMANGRDLEEVRVHRQVWRPPQAVNTPARRFIFQLALRGPRSCPHVPFITLNLVLTKERHQLLLKRHVPMMRLLIRKIRPNTCHLRLSYRKAGVSLLPPKRLVCALIQPRGRAALHVAHQVGRRCRLRETHKQMHVVRHPAGRAKHAIAGAADAADVGMKVRLHLTRDDRLPVLRREDEVHEDAGQSLCHRMECNIRRPLRSRCFNLAAMQACHPLRGRHTCL